MEKDRTVQRKNPKPKRTAKDTVFTSLFRDKEYLLQLYRALHPEDSETGPQDLTLITLENSLKQARQSGSYRRAATDILYSAEW